MRKRSDDGYGLLVRKREKHLGQPRVCRANPWVSPGFSLVLVVSVFCATAAHAAEPVCDIETRLYVLSLPIQPDAAEPCPSGIVEAGEDAESFEWQGHRFEIAWDNVRIDGEPCPSPAGRFVLLAKPSLRIYPEKKHAVDFRSQAYPQYFVPTSKEYIGRFDLKTSKELPGLLVTLTGERRGEKTAHFDMKWSLTMLGPREPLEWVELDVGPPTFTKHSTQATTTLREGDFFYHLFPMTETPPPQYLLTAIRPIEDSWREELLPGGGIRMISAAEEHGTPRQFTSETRFCKLPADALPELESQIRYRDDVVIEGEGVRAFRFVQELHQAISTLAKTPAIELLSAPKVTQLAYSRIPPEFEDVPDASPIMQKRPRVWSFTTPIQADNGRIEELSRGVYSAGQIQLDSACIDEVSRGGAGAVITDTSTYAMETAAGEERIVPVGIAVAVGPDTGSTDDSISVVLAVFERIVTDSGRRRWPIKDVPPTFATKEFLARFELEDGGTMGFLYPFEEAGGYRVVLFTSEIVEPTGARYFKKPEDSDPEEPKRK